MRRYFIRVMSFIISLTFTVNFLHNLNVSSETRARDLSFQAWNVLTSESELFTAVQTGDSFLSKTSNDAYETNAGRFYDKTGIRLAYLFNTGVIYPEYQTCIQNKDCKISNLRQKLIEVYPNLKRGEFVSSAKKFQDDWVLENINRRTLHRSKIWAFESYPISTDNYISFVVPFTPEEANLSVYINRMKFVSITKNTATLLHPNLGGKCLLKERSITSKNKQYLITYWKWSDMSNQKLLYKDLQVSVC